MSYSELKAILDARFAAELPVADVCMTTGERNAAVAGARTIIEEVANKHGFNPAAISTRWQFGKHITAF